MKKLGYLLFLLPAVVLAASSALAWRTASWNAPSVLVPVVVFLLLPLFDWWVGKDLANPDVDEEQALRGDRYYSLLVLACVPLQIVTLAAGVYLASHAPLSTAGLLGWMLAFGLSSSVVALTAGHELIHRASRGMQFAGGVLLASVSYGSFKVEHILGHHVHVATPNDPSTATRGQNLYGFLLRAFRTNIPRAFRLEQDHARRRGRRMAWWQSEVTRWTLLSAGLLLASALLGGPRGAAFFLGQSLVAITLLEIINYVEHYGLRRHHVGTRGAYAPTTPAHSWNSSYLLSNLFLFQLQRHSDHHANAARPYQVLRVLPVSPELPAGYPTMVLLALVPPWFRAVMDPRLPADV